MDKTQNLHHLLAELIRTHDLGPKMLEQKVFALWREYLGTPLGTGTVPVSLSNGILKIYTEYSAYIAELSLLKQKIIADLNAKLGQRVLTDLRIEIRPARAYSAYIAELSLLKQKIIADLNAKLGQRVLTDLRIEIRPARATKPHEAENRSSSPKTSKENSIISNQVPPVRKN